MGILGTKSYQMSAHNLNENSVVLTGVYLNFCEMEKLSMVMHFEKQNL